MKYYTNKDYENRVDLHGTATIKINEDIHDVNVGYR